ncbi:superoxide dismutase family protein [Sulfuritalea sp.]|uniref:superoxide dismutase family protein n=1 Tax=Sulfuritalea sp. TaxID=2480090 RepID=UPI00286DEEBC|nr:superoxide dismutase family protein [Sulfuritalea sp.]
MTTQRTLQQRIYATMYPTARIAALAAAGSLLAACAGMEAAGPKASATLDARSGSSVSGTVDFQAVGQKLRVEARVTGLTPGQHGFHVHEAGDCSAPDASSAKGHFNPAGRSHGHHGGNDRHAGDMPNLVADSAGKAVLAVEVDMLSLTQGPGGILQRSVVIHADADDYRSQPAGNSGKRVACGVIRPLAAGSGRSEY